MNIKHKNTIFKRKNRIFVIYEKDNFNNDKLIIKKKI